jgi:hypothetical protein
MPDNRRARRLFVLALAVPVVATVYAATFGGRIWAALRPVMATMLGVTVIGGVYADEALKRAPATPMRAAAAIALAVVLVAPGSAPSPVAAGYNPQEAVIAAAKAYLGSNFQIGAEGPRLFDCSGLVFRAFSDAGELPRIGGMRLLAAGYMRWFVSRGLFTKDQSQAEPGDLVVWAMGEHIGIYLGNNEAISALINPWGVSIHHLNTIHMPVSYFLKVDWSTGDNNGNNNNGNNNGNNNNNGNGNASATTVGKSSGGDALGGHATGDSPDSNSDNGQPDTTPQDAGNGHAVRGITTGTLNLRLGPDPSMRIIGWVSRGQTFRAISQITSPGGWVWYQIQTPSGKTGWIFSYWTRLTNN